MEELDREVARFGKKLAIYLKANLEEALRKDRKSVQEADLNFKEFLIPTNNGIKLQIVALAGGKEVDYWAYIEKGVDGTKVKHGSQFSYKKKAIDFDAVGKKWQNKHNIHPQKIMAEIELKYQQSKKFSRLSSTGQRLSKPKKKLSYNEAAKRLSRVFAVAIARDGLKPKPFVQQAIKEAKVDEFQKRVSEIMGKEISIQLQLDDNTFFKNGRFIQPIKLNF
jgi:hypothetical protein